MTDAAQVVTLTATLDATGAASALYSVAPARAFTARRAGCNGPAQAELYLYVNGVQIDATSNAQGDASELAAPLNVGDQIVAEWRRGAPGATMRVVIEGS